jgi:two-component system NtrC family sensor kinase
MHILLVVYGWIDRLAPVGSVADTITTLVLLIAGVLIYRTFRERYLYFWIIGWSAYLLYRVCFERAQELGFPPYMVALTYISFLLSSALFAAAVFDYLNRKRWFVYLLCTTVLAVAVATLRAYWLPTSFTLEATVQILYRLGTFAAGLQLALYSRGRRQLSPWLMAVMLLLVHIDFDVVRPHDHAIVDTLIESLLGLSMLVLVLDESRTRTLRLDVVDQVIGSMGTADDENVVMLTALQNLKKLMSAKAAWFRLVDAETLEMRAHIGLSDAFLRLRWRIPLADHFGQSVMESVEPAILTRRNTSGEMRQSLEAEGLDHVIVIPVRGKTSVIGMVALASGQFRRYREDELRFLTSASRQLGIAIENRQLITKILRSQRQWANTFDALPDPILVHDEKFNIVKVNRALLNKLRLAPEMMIGKTCKSVLPHLEAQWTGCPYCSAQATEFRDIADPCFGGYAIVSTTSYTADEAGLGGTVHIIRDTTARRAAEERYRTLFEQVQEGVFVSTPDGRVVDCNDAFVQLLGYDRREEVLAKDIAQTFYAHPTDRNVFLQKMSKHGAVKNFEVTLRRKDGSSVTVLENSYASRTASGNIVRYNGVLLDISEKKRAEDEVRRRNRELEALNAIAVLASQSFDFDEIVNLALRQIVDIFRADTAAIFLLDADKHLLRRCAAFGHLSDLGNKQLEIPIPDVFWKRLNDLRIEIVTHRDLAQLPTEFADFVKAEKLRSWLWVVLWSGDKITGVMGVSSRTEKSFTDRDEGLMIALGRQLANSIEKVRLYEETSKAYDNLRHTQEQLLQSEKMSAVGQLISGVAHELNNPLTAILGYAQLLEEEDISEHCKEFVNKLYKQAQRTQRVVQNLLSFARQRKPAKMPVDVRRIVEDTLALRDYDLNLHNIVVERHFAPSLPRVVADAHQLEQVFLNIINNAVDAMLEHSRGGKLEVTIAAENGQTSLEFHDSGPGIREVNRIFDPFYTTKSVGKGTGLGLSICYGIIKEHGGDIRAFNHVKGGAVLQIVLPSAAIVPESALTTEISGGRIPLQGRVLLVEDEEAVLEFEREVITGAGAEVECIASAEEAIAKLAATQFDAILVDSSMPGALSGIDVYRWLAEHRPESKHRLVLAFSSVMDSELREFVESNAIPWINKPFEVSELIAVVGRAMQERKAASAT